MIRSTKLVDSQAYWLDRVIVIDLPQLVDIASNPHAMALLERDCRNVCEWFTRRGVERDEGVLFAELIAEAF